MTALRYLPPYCASFPIYCRVQVAETFQNASTYCSNTFLWHFVYVMADLYHQLEGLNIPKLGYQKPVVSFVPSILMTRVRITSTPSTTLNNNFFNATICHWFVKLRLTKIERGHDLTKAKKRPRWDLFLCHYINAINAFNFY